MLCTFCSKLCASTLATAESWDTQQIPHKAIYDQPGQDASTLLSGNGQGCYICSTFWSRAPLAYRNGVKNNSLRVPHYQPGVVNSYEIVYMTTFEMRQTVRIFLYYDPAKPPSTSGLRRPKGGKREYTQSFILLPYSEIATHVPTNSKFTDTNATTASSKQIREWLDDCLKNHSHCKKPNQIRSEFPRRLISVESDIIKIQDSNTIRSNEQYVALSYCWGEPPHDILTPESQAAWYKGVHLAHLPKTFIDAVHVTRAVNIKYLWIDALCMMQEPRGNPEWKAESIHMGDIYSDAWCTIAATHGSNPKSGCFVTRSPRLLEYPPHSPPRGLTFRGQQFCVVDSNLWENAITQAPVNQRGWVLQERLLAPRTLHFCAEQIFWECVETAACESFPNGLPTELRKYRRDGERIPENEYKYFLREAAGEYRSLRSNAVDPAEVYDNWNIIVSEYSRRSISVPSDKLLAISSVAEKLRPAINDTLIAGLWKSYLPHGLSWSRDKSSARKTGTRLEASIAPTWSWASLQGKVEFPSTSKKWSPIIKVLRCPSSDSATAQGANQYMLTLHGPLQRLKVAELRRSSTMSGPPRCAIRLGGELFRPDQVIWDDRKTEDYNGASLYVVPLIIGRGVGARGIDVLMGIILEMYGGDRFKRVGSIVGNGQRNDQQLAVFFNTKPVAFNVV